MASFEMSEISSDHGDLVNATQACDATVKDSSRFAKIVFRLRRGARPTRTRRQPQAFPPRELQDQFVQLASTSSVYIIFLCLDVPLNNTVFKHYHGLVHTLRYLSADRVPRNDWFLARSQDFKPGSPSPCVELIRKSSLRLPVEPWLTTTSAFPVNNSKETLPRTSLLNEKFYASIMIIAILHERAEYNRLQQQQFNLRVAYPTRFNAMMNDSYTADVRMVGDLTTLGSAKMKPPLGARIKLIVQDLSVDGVILDYSPFGYDFRVIIDLTLLSSEVDYDGPNLRELIASRMAIAEGSSKIAEKRIISEHIPKMFGLDKQQTRVVEQGLSRVPSNTLFFALNALTLATIRLYGRVLICIQSNTGVDSLFEKVVKSVQTMPDFADLQQSCVRYRTNAKEIAKLDDMGHMMADQLRDETAHNNHSMAGKIATYAQAWPEDETLKQL
ncbi:hypothetical protein CLAFUR4_11724 [Fulvia fulva]|nr:hypothetical protein CLAFUR4_11724 [Fulvia fulva]